jgi:repressor LexA
MAELGKKIGTDSGNISNWENDKRVPGGSLIVALSDFYKVSTDWILKGSTEQPLLSECDNCLVADLNNEDKKKVKSYIRFLYWEKQQGIEESAGHDVVYYPNQPREFPEMVMEESSAYLPVVGEAAAGTPIYIHEALQGYAPVPAKHSRSRNFLVRVKGDSMTGAGIAPGDLVVIRPQPVVDEGEIALVRIEKEEATIKYFHRQGVDIILKPANSAYKDIIIRPDQHIDIVGKVIEVIKKEVADRHMRYPVE